MNKEIGLMVDIISGWGYSKKCTICDSTAKDEYGEMVHNKGCGLSPIVDKLITITLEMQELWEKHDTRKDIIAKLLAERFDERFPRDKKVEETTNEDAKKTFPTLSLALKTLKGEGREI